MQSQYHAKSYLEQTIQELLAHAQLEFPDESQFRRICSIRVRDETRVLSREAWRLLSIKFDEQQEDTVGSRNRGCVLSDKFSTKSWLPGTSQFGGQVYKSCEQCYLQSDAKLVAYDPRSITENPHTKHGLFDTFSTVRFRPRCHGRRSG